ncbi:uncharacterized protein LOC106658298 [Trichogramma pretiosum]|uniref:uncharacterized protein LOC106658298 n=1 Tax=Trichogramma pretiosum TaxID=7493 RepID=UPI0006C9E003|nr:uncharacterized protein LOC106658298 [Trichogramma pretiosum]
MEPVHRPIKSKSRKTEPDKSLSLHPSEFNFPLDRKDIINLESLRAIISLSSCPTGLSILKQQSEKWESVLKALMEFLSSNEDEISTCSNEETLLASHAYLSLRRALMPSLKEFEKKLHEYLNLNESMKIFPDLKTIFSINNLELFKHLIIHGFLQLGNSHVISLDVYRHAFDCLYPHCIRYTSFTYMSFRLLRSWMRRIEKTDFWSSDVCLDIEEKLEAIIFSNWNNVMCKSSFVKVFNQYLLAMQSKYDDYLEYLFHCCVDKISWCHVSKYAILAEICVYLPNIDLMTDFQFLSNLFNSLTLGHLSSASTRVYSIICGRIDKDRWKSAFGEHLKNYVIDWEAEKKYYALQSLCKLWIKPILNKHRDLLDFLLRCCDDKSVVYQSYLLRFSAGFGLPPIRLKLANNVTFLDHEEEVVRLNAFAANCCRSAVSVDDTDMANIIKTIQHFLFFNATADTTYLREGTIDHFKIFLISLLKKTSVCRDSLVTPFLGWLHEFFIDCFEIGSCYQRKILGLQLYKATLMFLHGDVGISKDPNHKEAAKSGVQLQTHMKDTGQWRFTDRETISLLLKLILDPASDVKNLATDLVVTYFSADVITIGEKASLFSIALNHCNSYKFFEIDSGSLIMKVLVHWFPLNRNENKEALKLEKDFECQASIAKAQLYSKLLFEEAGHQLIMAKRDILKAATHRMPFYGALTALSVIAFNNGPEQHLVTDQFLNEIMGLVENAAIYFLSAFSAKTHGDLQLTKFDRQYSSSFQEMGIAIDEAIKSSEISYEYDELVLSPAQQTVMTCIWRSLKVLCELAVEVAKHELAQDNTIYCAMDILVAVLMKCRQKGVIESAGTAIGKLTRLVTETGRGVASLDGYLESLYNRDFLASINLTRRGAGLTIMFHKIVANDVRGERPMLQSAVSNLSRSLRKSTKNEQKVANNCDDPCALHLHFFKTLVADKQLQAAMSPYLEDISLLCFEYLSSPSFTIRNGSLQLFGAIVSRLVGQNTAARILDFGYGYSLNYLTTHFPRLAAYILLTLQTCCQQWQQYRSGENVIHILSLLSKLFVSGCELMDGGVGTCYVRQIRTCLLFFFKSPIAHVRHLAAKAYVASIGIADLEFEISQIKAQLVEFYDFNQLNGYLLTLEYLYQKLEDEQLSTSVKHTKIKLLGDVRRNLQVREKNETLWNYWTRRAELTSRKKLCYSVEAQLLRLSRKFYLTIKDNQNDSNENSKSSCFHDINDKTRPGFFEFVDELSSFCVDYIQQNEDYALIKSLLSANCIDFATSFFKYAPTDNRHILISCIDHVTEGFDTFPMQLLDRLNVYCNESVRNAFTSRLLELQYIDIAKVKTFATKLDCVSERSHNVTELLILVHVLSSRGSGILDLFEDLISCIYRKKVTLDNYFDCPEHLRLLVAKALDVILSNFAQLAPNYRVQPLLAGLTLIRDDIDIVRQITRESLINNVILACKLSRARIQHELVHPVLMLSLSANNGVLKDLNAEDVRAFFRAYLSTIKPQEQQNSISSDDIDSPFDDNCVLSHAEETKIINFIVFCVQQKICNGMFTKQRSVYESISYEVFDIKHQLIEKMDIDLGSIRTIMSIKYSEYLKLKLDVVNEKYLKIK